MKSLLRGFLAAVLLVVADGAATFAHFPIGGGEFHAIFAYTSEGRLETAVRLYVQIVVVLASATAALLLLGFRLRWWVVAALASAVGLWHWWGICSWQPTSAHFHSVALTLLPGIPLVIFAVAAVAARVRPRHAARRESRPVA